MTKGERIKTLREGLNLAQTDVATAIGVSKQTLYKYENDIVTNIPSDKIEQLARVLFTTPKYIMGWEDEEPSKEENLTPEMARLIAMMTRNKIISQYAEKLFKLNERDRSIVFSLIDSMTEKDNSIPALRNEQNQE